jgi:hypothetical protein
MLVDRTVPSAMSKSIIGLIAVLFTAYVFYIKLNPSTEKPAIASVKPPPLSTSQMDAMEPGKGGPPDLSSLPPEMRNVAQKRAEVQAQAMINATVAGQNRADSAGADPGQMASIPQAPAAPIQASANPTASEGSVKQFNYVDRNDSQTTAFANGWTVVLERRLSDRRTSLADRVMTQLERQLERTANALPRTAIAELRKVTIWVTMESSDPQLLKYNWPEASKRDKAGPATRDGALVIARAEEFLAKSPNQPWMVMHELAHAYHHRVLGAENAAVRDAYQKARSSGAYAAVKNAAGATGRAPALTDDREYFAELTRAYYGKGDFYPFVREELREYDINGYRMIETAWAKR